MRKACIHCAVKHLAQAMVLLDEAVLGYPVHRLLAFGHMAEAESELIDGYLPLAEQIRTERVKAQEDPKYSPTIMELLEILSTVPTPVSE